MTMATDRPIRTQQPGVIRWIAQMAQAGSFRVRAVSSQSGRRKAGNDPQKVFRCFVRLLGRLRADGAQSKRPTSRASE